MKTYSIRNWTLICGNQQSLNPIRALLAPAPVCSLVVAVFLLFPERESLAQEDGLVIEEIIVTARKREESLLDVPESVTAFSSKQLDRLNIRDLQDISLLVPNLFMTRRLDGYPNVSMRGLGAFGNTQGVGFYLDDVQLFSDATSRFGDLQRIEVLKGPQGTLYGGSNIGGAVKFVSNRPDPEATAGYIQLRAGEDNYLDGEAEVNIPLNESWAMRLFGFTYTDDSYLVNPDSALLSGDVITSDADIGKVDESGGRISLAGSITDRLSMFASVRYNKLDAPNNVWVQELDGNLEHSNVVDTSFNPRHNRETTAASLELVYELDSFEIVSITSYTSTDSDRQTDLDIINEYILDLFRPEDLDVWTQELRFTSTGTDPFQWQAGVYALDYDRDLFSELLVRGGFCFLDPGECDPLPGPESSELLVALPFEYSIRNRSQYAAYGNFTYQLNDQWELSAGLRVDDWESKRTNTDTGISGSQGDTEFLGRGSLARHSEDRRSMAYLTVSQGFEPGDFNLVNFAGSNELFGYGPEKATQLEVGYKGRVMDDRAAFTVAAFYIDYSDRQFELQAADPSGGFVEGIINAGDSTNYGFEADLQAFLGRHWTATASVGYVDAEWENGTFSPITGRDLSGMTPPNTADWSGVLALDYNRDLDAAKSIFGRVQLRYKSDAATNAQFFDAPGDAFPIWENPSFTVVDLNIGMVIQKWTLQFQIENLFDEEYYIDAQEFPNFAGAAISTGQGSVVIGTLEQPRRAILSARYDF